MHRNRAIERYGPKAEGYGFPRGSGRPGLAFFFIFAGFFLEMYFPGGLRFFGVRPGITLVITLFFGLRFGPRRGLEIGFFSGFLEGLFSLSALGISVISFSAAGLAAGALRKKLFRDNAATQFIFAGLSVYLASAADFFYFREAIHCGAGNSFWWAVTAKALYTGFLAPVIFFACDRVFKKAERGT